MLVAALKVKRPNVGTAWHLLFTQLYHVQAITDLFPNILFGVQVITALIDVTNIDGITDANVTGIWLILASDHLKQSRLTSTVGANNAHNRTWWDFEAQIIDQQLVTIGFTDAFDLQNQVTQAFASRNHDTTSLILLAPGLVHQIIIGLDTRLALGLPPFSTLPNPVQLAGKMTLLRAFLFLFLR